MTDDPGRPVRRTAQDRCEYCRLPEATSGLRHQIDHVIARQHGGATEAGNLALSCVHCNLHKGPNSAGLDPATGELTRLFHPRRDLWSDHFDGRGTRLNGSTPVGRATVDVLAMNDPDVIAVRYALMEEGRFPAD